MYFQGPGGAIGPVEPQGITSFRSQASSPHVLKVWMLEPQLSRSSCLWIESWKWWLGLDEVIKIPMPKTWYPVQNGYSGRGARSNVVPQRERWVWVMSRGLQRNFPSYILIMDSSLQTQKRSTVQPYHFRPSQFVVFYYATMGGLTYILTQREPQGHPTFSLLTPTIKPWLDHEPWVVSLGEKTCILQPNCRQLERWLILGICPL